MKLWGWQSWLVLVGVFVICFFMTPLSQIVAENQALLLKLYFAFLLILFASGLGFIFYNVREKQNAAGGIMVAITALTFITALLVYYSSLSYGINIL
jgi:uncharacterized membrane protein HdeD (DUF308 family)